MNEKKELIKNKIIEVSQKRLTDKSTTHTYELIYPELLEKYLGKELNIFEVGTGYGGGLLILSDLFPESKIFALDHSYDCPYCLKPKTLPAGRDESLIINFDDRNVTFLNPCDQCDPIILNSIPDCDIIIEDASHQYHKSMGTFELLEKKIKKGGIYIIEDIYPEFKELYNQDERFILFDLSSEKSVDNVIAVYYKK